MRVMNFSVEKTLYLPSVTAFIIITVFDPADVVLGLKIPLFILCFITACLVVLNRSNKTYIPMSLIIYVLFFVTIPLFSILVYYIKSGAEPYEGFTMLKAYLFISFSIILVIVDIDMTRVLSAILSLLALCIICLFVFLSIFPEYFIFTNALGAKYEIFYVDMRSYGGSKGYQQVYFVCSPMLVIPIAYYFFRLRVSENIDFWSLILLLINIMGLFMAGSRNNMFAAIILLPVLYIIFSRNRILPIAVVSCILVVLASIYAIELTSFLDPNEVGNKVKFGYLPTYAEIFSELHNIIFGQGLGAYYNFSNLSYPYYITELTYLEIFRNFGLILGILMIIMLVFPIVMTFRLGKSALLQKYIVVAYSLYLLMCFTNPNLFNSLGIMILSLVLYGVYKNISTLDL